MVNVLKIQVITIATTLASLALMSCSDTSLTGSGKVKKKEPATSPSNGNALPTPANSKDNIIRIVCTKRDLIPATANGPSDAVYTRDYTVQECGGILPDRNYFAFSVDEEICGADREWTILTPRNGLAPGVQVRYLGHCPEPANNSLITTVWVHADSAKADGEAGAVNERELLQRIRERTSTITCRKTDFNPGTGVTAASKSFAFTSAECSGGKLPDSNYVGFLTRRTVCGQNESWTLPEAGKVSFWYLGNLGPCGDAAAGSDIEVFYILR